MYTPMQYYFYLRKVAKYSPRVAWMSCVMRYATCKAEYNHRLRRNSMIHSVKGWN